jgi:hypothetical protein
MLASELRCEGFFRFEGRAQSHCASHPTTRQDAHISNSHLPKPLAILFVLYTLATNITIWSEATLGFVLMLVYAVLFYRYVRRTTRK